MIKSVVTVQPDASVHDAVKLLNQHRIGCLVIVRGDNEIVGIVTERDLLERVLEKCKDPKKTKISEVMSNQVMTGTSDMDLLEAARLMFRVKVKKLPITDDNRLVGIITVTDIARAASIDQKTVQLIEELSNMHAY